MSIGGVSRVHYCVHAPLVGRVVVLDAALHVLQLVQHGKHVDELSQGEQVGLGYKVLPALGVTQATHLTTKTIDGSTLGKESNSVQLFLSSFAHSKLLHTDTPFYTDRTVLRETLSPRQQPNVDGCYLEVHEVHQLGDLRLQHLHCLLVDLHSVGLLVALYLKKKKNDNKQT